MDLRRSIRLTTLLTVAATAASAGILAAVPAGAAEPLATFRMLFLIYPQTRVPGQPAHDYPAGELDRARNAALVTFPQEVSDLTGGMVRVVPTVVVVPHPLTSNSASRNGTDPNDYPGVFPEDVPDDVRDYVLPAGKYDSVMVWDANPVYHPISYGGANSSSARVTWGSIGPPVDPTDWGRESDVLAGTKHEWLHGLTEYSFGEQGLRSRAPQCADDTSHIDGVHCGGDYGYTRDAGGHHNWNAWYADLLSGSIRNGTIGLGPAAYAKPVPRARFGGPADGSIPTTTTSTTTRSTTTTSRTTTTGPAGGACTASLSPPPNTWNTGFVAYVTVAAASALPWKVTVTLPPGARITNLWNGVASGSTGTVTVTGAGWNSTVPAGGTQTFGFQADGSPTGLGLACARA